MQERLIELLLNCLHWEAGRITADDLAVLSDGEWDGFLSLAAEQRIRKRQEISCGFDSGNRPQDRPNAPMHLADSRNLVCESPMLFLDA